MIKLKDILLEGLDKNAIMSIVKRVYPKIVSSLGRSRKGTPKVSVHSSIYTRFSGIEGMMGTANPHNVIRACMKALTNQNSPKHISITRNKKISEVIEKRG